jgi:hypothetical protein
MLTGGVLDWMSNWLSGSIFAAVTIVALVAISWVLGAIVIRMFLDSGRLYALKEKVPLQLRVHDARVLCAHRSRINLSLSHARVCAAR